MRKLILRNGKRVISLFWATAFLCGNDQLNTLTAINSPTGDQVTTYTSGSSGTFAGIDLFGRVVDQQWVTTGGSPTDKDRYQYGYDRNSNRQYRANVVGTTAVGNLDEHYTYDNLNRLTVMKRGTLTGSPPTGISGTPVAEQDWTLDPTGNWNGFIIKDNTGSQTLNQSRTQSKVNEIATITASGGTPVWAAPAYDAAGNMTTMPKPSSLTNSYTATYDAWNRMRQVKDGGTLIATYSYDGRNRRIVATTSLTRHFYFTNSWQDVEERLGTLTSADQQYVWGIRYIDELVCRDRLVSGSSSSSSSSSGGAGLNERLYATQDANFNVTSLLDTSANVAERYTYDPYGTPTFRSASWASIGASAKASTILYAGYHYDVATGLYTVRNRYLHANLGVWNQRDDIDRIIDGLNLYSYCRQTPLSLVDPFGREAKDSIPEWIKACADVPKDKCYNCCNADTKRPDKAICYALCNRLHFGVPLQPECQDSCPSFKDAGDYGENDNCLTYGTCSPSKKGGFGIPNQRPGENAGKDCGALRNALIDSGATGPDKFGLCPCGSFPIAYYLMQANAHCPAWDYHVVRQNDDGSWSHITGLGKTPVKLEGRPGEHLPPGDKAEALKNCEYSLCGFLCWPKGKLHVDSKK